RPACLPEQLWLSGDGGSPAAPHSSSFTSAGAFASSARTAASCASSARWDAEAIARSRALRSVRTRANGSAWSGFDEGRLKTFSEGSPASATTAPSCTATACKRWTASTISPRRTDTLIASMQWRLERPRGGLWDHPDFMKLWAGQTISEFGTPVSQIAIPWIAITNLHESAFAVASLTTVQFLPFLLFTLPAGVWVDRLSRRLILIVGDLGRAVLLLTIPLAWALGGLSLTQLYAVR